jgi:hypothetical protein
MVERLRGSDGLAGRKETIRQDLVYFLLGLHAGKNARRVVFVHRLATAARMLRQSYAVRRSARRR